MKTLSDRQRYGVETPVRSLERRGRFAPEKGLCFCPELFRRIRTDCDGCELHRVRIFHSSFSSPRSFHKKSIKQSLLSCVFFRPCNFGKKTRQLLPQKAHSIRFVIPPLPFLFRFSTHTHFTRTPSFSSTPSN